MCGRFTLTTPIPVLADLFLCPEMANQEPHYNIAPTQAVATVPLNWALRLGALGTVSRKRRFRIVQGLPRGGLGRVGCLPSLTAVAVALFAHPAIAILVGFLCFPVCAWCAVGLRRGDAAGEASDWYTARWHISLFGEWEPARRRSTAMIGWCLLGLFVSAVRWWLLA